MTEYDDGPLDEELLEEVERAYLDLTQGYAAARMLRDAAPEGSPLRTANLEEIRFAMISSLQRHAILPGEHPDDLDDGRG